MSDVCHLCGAESHIGDRIGYWCDKHWAEAEAEKRTREKQATVEAGGPWTQTCPYRMVDLGPWPRTENADTWDIREQFHGGLVARHCSFCGSLNPDDLIRLMREEGYSISGTDKGYKVYVNAPGDRQVSKFKTHHLSDEQRAEITAVLLRSQERGPIPGGFLS